MYGDHADRALTLTTSRDCRTPQCLKLEFAELCSIPKIARVC